jgi:hypothetical protein
VTHPEPTIDEINREFPDVEAFRHNGMCYAKLVGIVIIAAAPSLRELRDQMREYFARSADVTGDDDEGALGKELGRALKTARMMAGLAQRELAHMVGYSRSRVAGAEAGDVVAGQFWERCDAVLGTTLAQGYAVIRALRTRRLLAALGADSGEELAGFWQRCGVLVATTPVPVPGNADIHQRPAVASQERYKPPVPVSENRWVNVRAASVGGVWHIEIYLPPEQVTRRGRPDE